MRDILIIVIICAAALRSLKYPWIGVILWTWVSLMSPHTQFGWQASNFPVAMIAGGSTLLGLLMTRDKVNPFTASPVWALLALTLMVTITIPASFDFDDSVWLWNRSMKIWLMVFVSIALINTRRKLDWFVGIVTFSVGFYGVKGGVFTIATGGNFRVWGPGGFIEGNNEIALALTMTIPLMRYFQLQAQKRWQRWGLLACMGLTAICVLGTYSRGALIGLGAMAAFLWLKGDKKVLFGALLIGLAMVVLPLMPEAWWSRMDTIKSYEEDASAMGRINAWKMAWNLALHNPVGGGFSIYNPTTFRAYAPDPLDIHAAHSIYFQILGEHGFPGLLLFLGIFLLTWNCARRTMAQVRHDPSLKWAADLVSMVQVSLIGFLVGGAFLSLAYFDMPYDLMAVVVIAMRLVSIQVKATRATQATQAAAGRAAGLSAGVAGPVALPHAAVRPSAHTGGPMTPAG